MSTPPNPAENTAGRLAQLLSETQITAAPHIAKINETHRREALEGFLEGLEAHTAGQVGPFLQWVKDNADLPPQIAGLLDEAIEPPAQFSAFMEQIFLYGIISNVVGTSLGPFIQGVANQLSATAVAAGINKPTDPSILATAVGRGLNLGDPPTVTVPAWAYEQAAQSGISGPDVDLMASIIGLPPAFEQLLEMKRRSIITEDQLEQGLREGDFRDDWIQYAVQLIQGWPTPTDFVRAAVQSQMAYSDARDWAEKTGLDVSTEVPIDTGATAAGPDMFGLLYGVAGRPPGPEEAARMALRGIIPWDGSGAGVVSFEQIIAESDVKVKYTDALQQLSAYVPPPRAIGTLLERGVISKDTAIGYWEMGGVPTELANAYAAMAEQQSTIQDKLLGRGDIITAYYDKILTNEQATTLLGDLGYNGQVAAYILSITDFRREIQAVNSIVRKVGTLYENFKISATDAQTAMTTVGLTVDQATELLGLWDTLRIAPIRVPTAEEISLAVKYGTLTVDQAQQKLIDLGYQGQDAQIVLSAHGEVKIGPLASDGTTTTG